MLMHDGPKGGELPARRETPLVYNLFQRKTEPDLYCAVPEDRPVPPFIRDESWRFLGRIEEGTPLDGFQAGPARLGVHYKGFHLFMALSRVVLPTAMPARPRLVAAA